MPGAWHRAWGNALRRNVNETIRSLVIEPDHLDPRRLPIHPADIDRLSTGDSIRHGRDRQQPPSLPCILRLLRKPANLAGTYNRSALQQLGPRQPALPVGKMDDPAGAQLALPGSPLSFAYRCHASVYPLEVSVLR